MSRSRKTADAPTPPSKPLAYADLYNGCNSLQNLITKAGERDVRGVLEESGTGLSAVLRVCDDALADTPTFNDSDYRLVMTMPLAKEAEPSSHLRAFEQARTELMNMPGSVARRIDYLAALDALVQSLGDGLRDSERVRG